MNAHLQLAHSKPNWKLNLITILSALGLGVSLFQTFHFFQIRNGLGGFKSFCTFGPFNCEAVEMSSWAEFFPGFPLSAFAAGWFLTQLVFSFRARRPSQRAKCSEALFILSGIGSLISLLYLFIMVKVLNQLCLLCLVVDGANIFSFIFSIGLKDKSTKLPLKAITTTLAVCIAATLILGRAMDPVPLSEKNNVELAFQEVLQGKTYPVKVSDTDLSFGPKDAPITVVKFSDFQCPACKNGALNFHPIMERYRGKIHYVVKNFPLSPECNRMIPRSMHIAACISARAAICAGEQGKFKEVYEKFFENQETLSQETVNPLALSVGLDSSKFEICLKSPSTEEKLKATVEEGIALALKSTPTFFINGLKVEGFLPTALWAKLVDHLLAKKP